MKLEAKTIKNKKVFLRVDLDVPILDGKIEDDSRLRASLPTIEFLLKNNSFIILAGHRGRPACPDPNLSLAPIANWYKEILKTSIAEGKLEEFEGWKLGQQIFLLENLRFFRGEEENSLGFARNLAKMAEAYVNDAFAVSHRAHASIVGIAQFLPHFCGLRLQEEIEVLSKVLKFPERPLVVIIGGAKLETKLPLVKKMHGFSDFVLVGGEIAEQDRFLLKIQHDKIKEKKSILLISEQNEEGTDVTKKSAENFVQIIRIAKTIIWNGPLGIVEKGQDFGTREVAEAIISSKAYSLVGGGDTVSYLRKINLADKFSFVSTGGGAMLEFLSGEKLPGLEALGI